MSDPQHLSYLTSEQFSAFQDQGYLHLENVLSDRELGIMQSAIEGWVSRLVNKWMKRGLIDHDFSDAPFDRRYLEAWRAVKDAPVKTVVTKEIAGKAFFDFANTPAIVNIARDLTSSPNVQALSAYMCRPTFPNTDWDFDTPWHQDAQCTHDYGLDESMNVVTLWIPFMDIDEDYSCLQFEEGYLKKNMLHPNANPTAAGYCVSEEVSSTFQNVKTVPVKRGDIICIHKLTPHGALPNRTQKVRWSIDMRFEGQHEAELKLPKRGFFISHNDPSQLPKNHQEAFNELWGAYN